MSTPDEALRLIRDLPESEILQRRQEALQLYQRLSRILRPAPYSLVEALDEAKEKIETFLKKPIDEAIARELHWEETDWRIVDIRLDKGNSPPTSKFRKGLGQRSLALQFEDWEIRNHQTSRIQWLLNDTDASADVGDGYISEFLAANSLPNKEWVRHAIKHGIKLALFERMTRMVGISALLFFCYSKFRGIRYHELGHLQQELATNGWVIDTATTCADWFDACQNAYNRQCRVVVSECSVHFPLRPLRASNYETAADTETPTLANDPRLSIPPNQAVSVCSAELAPANALPHRRSDFSSRTILGYEHVFNQATTLCHVRPYDASIFIAAQIGDIAQVEALMARGLASVYDTDQYGLDLVYYAAYYCLRGSGPQISMELLSRLLQLGAGSQLDDIAKFVDQLLLLCLSDLCSTPLETVIDGLLIAASMNRASVDPFSMAASLFGLDAVYVREEYLSDRQLPKLHRVLLQIDKDLSLEEYLTILQANGELKSEIDLVDAHFRSALAWAAEYGWAEAVELLLKFGADATQPRGSPKGCSPLLNLVLAGSYLQFQNRDSRRVIQLLVEGGTNPNEVDHEGWTSLHIAASWDHTFFPELLPRDIYLKWDAVTHQGESVDDLCPGKDFRARCRL